VTHTRLRFFVFKILDIQGSDPENTSAAFQARKCSSTCQKWSKMLGRGDHFRVRDAEDFSEAPTATHGTSKQLFFNFLAKIQIQNPIKISHLQF